MRLADLPTPFAVVDRARLDANIAGMARLAEERGVRLRPHAKTHKMVEVARAQRAAGAVGLTVATLGEALVLAEAGDAAGELFVAYPLWWDAGRARLLRHLLDRGVVPVVGCDSAAAARGLAAITRTVPVLVEVDSGHHRSGVAPEEVARLTEEVRRTGLTVTGAFTFPGHSYHPDQRAAAALQEASALAAARAGLAVAGVGGADVVLSGGSTPSMAYLAGGSGRTGGLTEARPGVYVFGDAQQWELGACRPSDIALTVHGTVVSRRGDRVVLDTGSKVLGADRAPWATGFGRLLDHPDARIVQLSEHHCVVEWNAATGEAGGAGTGAAGRPPALGERLRVVPNHVCNAVNLLDEVWALAAPERHDPADATPPDLHGGEVERWAVAARGRNS